MVRSDHILSFVHLRVQSSYSIGTGVSTPWEICAHASRCGYTELALADIGGTWGYPEFHRAARHFGIKPVYGVTLGLVGKEWRETTGPMLVLLALDKTGLENVSALASLSTTRGVEGPSVTVGDIRKRADGIVCIVEAPVDGDETDGGNLIREMYEDGIEEKTLEDLKGVFGDRLYAGFSPRDDETPDGWTGAVETIDIPQVLTQDVRYVGFKSYSMAVRDSTNGEAEPEEAGIEEIDRYRFLSLTEVSPWYSQYRDAYVNASKIASLVRRDLLRDLDEPLPGDQYQPVSLFDTDEQYIRDFEEEVENGFNREFGGDETGDDLLRYRKILEGELRSIRDSGLAGLFLCFSRIIARLRLTHVILGPSTGLKLQSLCAYLLGITTFNPYVVDEYFTPQLDDDRESRGILEIQVARSDRALVASAIRQLFDNGAAGYVPSIEHVTPLRALKVAGGETNISEREYSELIRIAGDRPGVPLMKLCEENTDIGRLYRKSASVRELVSTAAAIEGLPTGFVKSKRTMIASLRKLTNYFGHEINHDTNDLFFQVTRDAFPTKSVFRIDLSTLTSLGTCEGVARYTETIEQEREAPAHMPQVPCAWVRPPDGLQQAPEFELVADGDVDGIYLLESPLTRRLAPRFGVDSFDSLVNFLGLMRLRRGDLSFTERVEAFVERSRKIDRTVSAILEPTNGWVLFDDQLRGIVSVLTALPGQEAAALLGRFESRDTGDLADLRRDFMAFTVEAEVPIEEAKSWFKRVLFLTGKTLDRQRVIADALVIYRMLLLKHDHRTAFFAALLNEHRGRGARFDAYIGTVESEGLLLAPDVNRSGDEYLPEKGLIRAPLDAIDGLGTRTAREIVRIRGDDRFSDMKDFLKRMPAQLITNKEIESIVDAGAIDAGVRLGAERAGAKKDNPVQNDTDGKNKTKTDQFALSLDTPSFPGKERNGESSGKVPLTKKDGNLRGSYHVLTNIAEFYPHPSATRVELAGHVRDLHKFKTSSGDETCFFVLFDTYASVPVFAPRERIGRQGEPSAEGERVLVRGVIKIRDRRKVCEAAEVVVAEEGGAIGDGETSPDESAEGDP